MESLKAKSIAYGVVDALNEDDLADICIDSMRDHFVLLYEIYTDKVAFDAHLDSNHFQEFNSEVQNWVSDKKVACLEKI